MIIPPPHFIHKIPYSQKNVFLITFTSEQGIDKVMRYLFLK